MLENPVVHTTTCYGFDTEIRGHTSFDNRYLIRYTKG